ESHRGKIASFEQQMDETLQLRTNNATARERVEKQLDDLGQQIDAEKETLKQKEQELQSRKFQPMPIDELRRTIARPQNGNGERDVYKLRAQIAARLKSLVSTILVAVEGFAPVAYVEGEEDTLQKLESSRRWFNVEFHDQKKVRVIAPNPDNPRELVY